jgi:hypothetical protein
MLSPSCIREPDWKKTGVILVDRMNIHIAIKLDDRKTVDIGFFGDPGNFHFAKRLFLMTRNKQQYRHRPHQKMYQFHTPMQNGIIPHAKLVASSAKPEKSCRHPEQIYASNWIYQ